MILLANLTLALLPQPVATTWYVDVNGTAPGSGTQSDPYTSIQYAIDQAATLDGDTLEIATGTYYENVDLSGKDLRLDGSAADPIPRLHGQGLGSTLTIANGESAACEIRSLQLIAGTGTLHGLETHGGGAWIVDASPTFENVAFTGNSAENGGGAAVLGFTDPNVSVSFNGCSFQACGAERGGGLWVRRAEAKITFGEFEFNHFSFADFGHGGCVYVGEEGSLDADQVTFYRNESYAEGRGGAVAVGFLGDATFTGCTFNRNHINHEPGMGGAICAVGPVHAEDCLFRFNQASRGGAIQGNVTAVDCTFERNYTGYDGDGRGGAAADAILVDCALIQNTAYRSGGGAQDCVLENCDVLYNTAYGKDAGGKGGGLAQCTATDCRIIGNIAKARGQWDTGQVSQGGGARGSTLIRCVVANNWAQLGGGTYNGHTERASFVGNRAERGGALHGGSHDSGILWNNGTSATFGSPQIDYSCVEGGFPGTGNIDLDPMLFGLAGSDVHVRSGSPVIDAGNPVLPPDADGSPADMGALAFDPTWMEAPASFCLPTLVPHCLPTIEAFGSASVSGADQLVVDGFSIPVGTTGNGFGVLAVGPGAGMSFHQDGVLCLDGPLTRYTVQPLSGSWCAGHLVETLTATDLAVLGVFPGDRIYAQYFFRDAEGELGFTNALEIPIVP